MFDVSTSVIRYWETEFKFLNPKKNKKGDRRFTKDNIVQLQIIYELVKVRGFTLDGAKQEIKSNKKRLKARQELLTRLHVLKSKMLSLKDQIEGD